MHWHLQRHLICKNLAQSLRLQVFGCSSCSHLRSLLSLAPQSLCSKKWEGQPAFVWWLKLFKVSPHEYTQTVTLQLISRLFIQQGHQPHIQHTIQETHGQQKHTHTETHNHRCPTLFLSLCYVSLGEHPDSVTLYQGTCVYLLYSHPVTLFYFGIRAFDTNQIWPLKRSCRCFCNYLNLEEQRLTITSCVVYLLAAFSSMTNW